MKTTTLIGTIFVASLLAACGVEGQPSSPSTNGADANPGLADDLRFLREEEKLARDVYLTLFDVWQLRPHQNIAASEQTHTDRVKGMLLALGISDPVEDDTVGVFVNTELATLYSDLTALGMQSEVAALNVGATIEDLDIRDIEQMMGRTQDANILSLYAALQCGSRNHLRAFTSELSIRGVSYSPQYLGQADYDAILTGAHERCGQ